jgi:hypothetical protein
MPKLYCPTCKRHGRDTFWAANRGRVGELSIPISGVPTEISPTRTINMPCCLECAIARGFAHGEGAQA